MTHTVSRPLAAAFAAILATTLLAACGDDSNAGSSASSSSAPASPYSRTTTESTTTAASTGAPATGSALKLAADSDGQLKFDKSELVAKAGTVTVTMSNPATSGEPHGIAVEGNGVDKDGATVQPGGTSSVTVKLKPGTYTFYCPVPGHEEAGMKGALTVN